MKQTKAMWVAYGGVIAALYVVLTLLANLFGLANGAIQIRISEALTILPVFTAAAIPGLTAGCVLANLITGCVPWDIVFGSLATLLGAIGTRALRKEPYFAWIPPVVSNAVIVPVVLMKAYGVEDVAVFGQTFAGNALWPVLILTIVIGEVISCGALGLMLYHAARKIPQLAG